MKQSLVIFGMWHLGLVNAVGFCEKGYTVTGIEPDAEKLRALQEGKAPLFEPNLDFAIERQQRWGNLKFVDSGLASVLFTANAVVLAYDLPTDALGFIDLTCIGSPVAMFVEHAGPDTMLIVTSQVPVGTCKSIEATIQKHRPDWRSGVVYTPENLQLGCAIDRFLWPEMVVLGTSRPAIREAAMAIYALFRSPKVCTDLNTAEMVKHALNAYVANSISFINEIACLCKRLDADAMVVGSTLKLDKRVGHMAPLRPGLGFSGGTLARDVQQLQQLGENNFCPTPMMEAILQANEETYEEVIRLLVKHLDTPVCDLKTRTVGFLGLTYKPDTSTLRQSPALRLAAKLQEWGVRWLAYDPMAEPLTTGERASSPYELASQVDALVLVTEWPVFRELDYELLARKMKKAVLIDAKNFLDPERVKKAGFAYEGFGR